jgi:hypothetical protein
VADILTKLLTKRKFEILREKLWVIVEHLPHKEGVLDSLVARSCSPFNLEKLSSNRDCRAGKRAHL